MGGVDGGPQLLRGGGKRHSSLGGEEKGAGAGDNKSSFGKVEKRGSYEIQGTSGRKKKGTNTVKGGSGAGLVPRRFRKGNSAAPNV